MEKEPSLSPGNYILPPDCRAIIRNGKVVVFPRQRKSSDAPQCRFCTHCIMAYSIRNTSYSHPVCDLRPKPKISNFDQGASQAPQFYMVRPFDVACDKYEPRNTSTTNRQTNPSQDKS